jgi:hypothetical protein
MQTQNGKTVNAYMQRHQQSRNHHLPELVQKGRYTITAVDAAPPPPPPPPSAAN